MTSTLTPYRSAAQSPRDDFAQLLHAEWTKFRTVRGWLIGMGIAAVVTVLIGMLGPLGTHIACSRADGKACAVPAPTIGPDGEAVNDIFYFVHQPLAADGSLTVRVASLTGQHPDLSAEQDNPGSPNMQPGLQPWSKAGIMIKQNTDPGSAYAAVMATGGHGVRMQYNYTHDTAGLPGAVSPTDARWLRLTRTGDAITGYDSANGADWTAIGTVHLAALSSTVQIGLFASSPEYYVSVQDFGGSSGSGGPSEATAAFDSVSLQGASAQGAWAGTALGGGKLDSGYQQAGGTFSVTGVGDIAPLVSTDGDRAKTVSDALVGAFAGLVAVIVVAAMFMTAEYRRGLIRTTLAASPRRGRMLAAKAVVIGAAAFVTGLAACVVAVPVIDGLERGKGLYVEHVSTLTELRAVAGTAAVLAVSAVLALAIGTILRRSAGTVAVVIVVIVLPYILSVASLLPTGAAQWLTRLTPAAAFAIQQTKTEYTQVLANYTPANGFFPLSPWAGFAVLCAYTAAALALAAVLLRRRDA
jgi:ABC-type transport system involved in multi-copper enzyme maturation permease subunit